MVCLSVTSVVCDYTSKSKKILDVHNKTKHDDSHQKFRCETCEKIFDRKDNLRTHFESQHLNIKYPCDQCEYQGTRQAYLNMHMKTFHNSV